MKAFRLPGDLDADAPEVAVLWRHGCTGVLQDGAELVAYFDRERPLPVPGRWEEVPDTDWLASYYATLEPVQLDTLVIAPTHTQPALRAGQKVLWLDPGTAFGTGHHETTRLALRALERAPLAGSTVLDVGAGSGILAIAADLLGAARAHGVDLDAATVPVARENARLNRSRATFAVGTLDGRRAQGEAHLLVANLFAELHARLMPSYARAVRPGGRVLLTGILREREATVTQSLPEALQGARWHREGEWSLLELERA